MSGAPTTSPIPPDSRRCIERSASVRVLAPVVGALIVPAVFLALFWRTGNKPASWAIVVFVGAFLGMALWCGFATESAMSAIPLALTTPIAFMILARAGTNTDGLEVVGAMLVLIGGLLVGLVAAGIGKWISRRTRRITWRLVDSERY